MIRWLSGMLRRRHNAADALTRDLLADAILRETKTRMGLGKWLVELGDRYPEAAFVSRELDQDPFFPGHRPYKEVRAYLDEKYRHSPPHAELISALTQMYVEECLALQRGLND